MTPRDLGSLNLVDFYSVSQFLYVSLPVTNNNCYITDK